MKFFGAYNSVKSVLCKEFSGLKQLFNIQLPAAAPDGDQVLLCELSYYHLCFGIADAASRQLVRLSYFEQEDPITPSDIRNLLQREAVPGHFKKVVLGSAFPEVSLAPLSKVTNEVLPAFLNSGYEPSAQTIFYDKIKEQDLAVVYTLPVAVLNTFGQGNMAEPQHIFTTALKMYHPVLDNQIGVHFTSREMKVIVKKNRQLQLAQTYTYSSSLDVIYYLLTICQAYAMAQEKTAIVISGLIDQESALYEEIHQYFSILHFDEPGNGLLPEHEYPKHFFSSMHNLASCAL